ncbi:unnamed protein product [Rhizophagus irregularis]|nr:unnamed protein product [Rhizophagus irregularis]CAB5351694.1 unnamed protein product [Rhizophagus irregularis]
MVCLIIARAIAGLGGGGIIGLVYIIISDIVSLQDRGKYQGMIGGVFGISSVVGPLLGGAFTDSVTWRWAFYINLPFGVITVVCVILFLHLPHISGSFLEKFKRIDFLGTFVLVIATIALLLPLNWGGNKYKWDSPIIIVLLCIGGLGFIVFALVEKYVAVEPIAPGRLFKNRMVIACFAVNFFQGMSFFAMVYFIPLFFQIVKGATATKAGLDLLPLILAVVFTVIFTGQLISRTPIITYKMYCTLGGIFIIIGSGLMSTFSETSKKGELIGYLLIAGIGIGCIMQITILASQHVAAREDLASVTSLMTFFRTIGAVFGVAILGTVFNNELKNHLSGGASSFSQSGFGGGERGGLGNVPDSIKPLILNAFISSFSLSFKVVTVMGALTLISALFMENTKPAGKRTSDSNSRASTLPTLTTQEEEELQILITPGRPLNALITQEEEELQILIIPGRPLNAYVTLITTQEEEELQILTTEEEIQILTTPGRVCYFNILTELLSDLINFIDDFKRTSN